MEGKLSECEAMAQDGGLCVCKGGPTLEILKEVQRAYEQRIELLNKNGGKNKLQKELQLLRAWVSDLVEQNGLLARAVEEMEADISARMVMERRQTSEREGSLVAEVGALRRRLERKEADVRGLLELLRRLRDYDRRDIHDIRFYDVTERDIFGCTGQTDMENEDNKHWDPKKGVRDKINELKLLNDTLQKENYTKEREIRKLSNDIQQCEHTIAALKKEIAISRTVPTKDEEVMTEVSSPIAQCEDIVPEQDYGGGWPARPQTPRAPHAAHPAHPAHPPPHAPHAPLAHLDLSHKWSEESVRAVRKQNVELKEEVRAVSQLCGALYEQRHAAQLRLQFKDDIIREMRRQLRQAKAKLEGSKCAKGAQKPLSAEREDGSGAAGAGCVRRQPRRSRHDIEWECHSHDASPDDTDSIKVD